MLATDGTIVVCIVTGDMVQHTGPVKLVPAPGDEQIGRGEVVYTYRACAGLERLRDCFGQVSVCTRRHFFVIKWKENSGRKVDCLLGGRITNRRQRSDWGAVSRRRCIHNIMANHSLGRAWWGNDVDDRTLWFGLSIENNLV